MNLKTGDTIITSYDTYLVISSEDFDLHDENREKVNVILVNVKRGSMEGYDYAVEDLWHYLNIREVIPNEFSRERSG